MTSFIFTAGGFLNQKFKPKAIFSILTWGQDIRKETAALDSLDATILQKAERPTDVLLQMIDNLIKNVTNLTVIWNWIQNFASR